MARLDPPSARPPAEESSSPATSTPAPARRRSPSGEAAPADLGHAPSVVAVVVTHDAGPWFEDALRSLGEQDYPNLSVLVVDAASEAPALPRVAPVLPAAYVHRLDGNPGFAAAANEVLDIVEGAAFYLACHDDASLEPDVVSALVTEALRSDAGIVGPKLVAWDAPASLLQVGESVDKTGVAAPLVERGELDQEQHDAVRDVFAIPGGCTLVRAELFEGLHGFDPAISFLGEDLDLCWRAQIAGARVVVAPEARVRHREALASRRPLDDRRRLQERHRLRTLLTCYGTLHLARVLPWAAALAVVEAVFATATGHLGHAGDVAGAWTWNLRRWSDIRRRRRAVRATRQLPDHEVRRLQVRGSARLNAYVRGELGSGEQVHAIAGLGRELSGSLATPTRRPAVLAWSAVILVLVVGSRDLLGDALPAIGSIVPFPAPLELLRTWASGFRPQGLGGVGPAPPGLALVGLAGVVALGRMAALQQVLVLGMIPVGLVGMWHLTRPIGSNRARAAGLVAYAAVPLPYDALAEGSWPTLLLYGAAPWILGRLLGAGGSPLWGASSVRASSVRASSVRASSVRGSSVRGSSVRGSSVRGSSVRGSSVRGSSSEVATTDRRSLVAAAASLGLVVALLSAFVPLLAAVVPIMALALALGAAAAGRPSKGWHGVVVALAASVVAVVVLLPWSFDLLGPNRSWWGLGGIATLGHARVPVTELLRFGSGTDAASPLGWGLLVAASLPLLLGRGWRFTVAVQAWLVALAFWLLVFADGRDLIGVPLPPVSLLLVPAAAALALAAALGVAAAELDLRSTRFGGRRGVAALAGIGLLLAALPTVVAALDGRWSTPDTDFAATLGFTETDEAQAEGDHRILWVGDPASLPVGGQRLGAGLAYGISERGTPTIAERWTMPDPGATALAAEALRLAGDGRTDRLGRLLAPFGIRYLVLPSSSAPARAGSVERPVPAGLLGTASRQLDLATIDVDAALAVYENAAWVPVVAVVPDGEASTATGTPLSDDAGGLDLSGARPILNQRGVLRYRGEVPEGTVYLAEAMAPGWELLVDGEAAPRSVALGWANAFDVADGGEATLRYRTGVLHRLGLVAQVALWSALVVAVVARRRST